MYWEGFEILKKQQQQHFITEFISKDYVLMDVLTFLPLDFQWSIHSSVYYRYKVKTVVLNGFFTVRFSMIDSRDYNDTLFSIDYWLFLPLDFQWLIRLKITGTLFLQGM